MKLHRIVIIFTGIALLIGAFLPWIPVDIISYSAEIATEVVSSRIIVGIISITTIIIGVYHKPKPGVVYSWFLVLLSVVNYFSVGKVISNLAEQGPQFMGIGVFVSSICSIALMIGGIIPSPKDDKKLNNGANWRDIVMGVVGVGIIVLLLYSLSISLDEYLSLSMTNANKEQSTDFDPTSTIYPTPNTDFRNYLYNSETTSTSGSSLGVDPTCKSWDEITIEDIGLIKCVYGTVEDSYWGEDIFYIRFSKEANSFRFIVLNNRYFKDINGKCIQSTGEIKTFGDIWYIEVGDALYHCN